MSVQTTPAKVSMRSRRPPLPPASLASRLSAFEPPVPPAASCEMLSSACASTSHTKLAEARLELKALADAARSAAMMCPQAGLLADHLCTVVARELEGLSADPDRHIDRREMEQRVHELRKATAEGLQVLDVALRAEGGLNSNLGDDSTHSSDMEVWKGNVPRSPAASTVSWRSSPKSPAEIAGIFGVVAANMQRTVDEIREARGGRPRLQRCSSAGAQVGSPTVCSNSAVAAAAAAGA